MKKNVIQWCPLEECDNKPEEFKVGNKKHTFCCEKGFKKSLKDFAAINRMGNHGQ